MHDGSDGMFNKTSRIAVVGAGAIGGITAGFIARAGYDIELVCKYRDLADKIAHHGVHVFGVKGDFRAPMPAVEKIRELSGTKDIILLATKATDMLEAARELLPFLTETSVVVSLQNGICEDALATIVGRERTVGCVVGWGATMLAPGELEMTSTGEFVVGNIDNKSDSRLPFIQEMLSTVVPVEISNNIIGYLYSKLIINSCITSLGAVCGLALGEMLSVKKIRNIFIAIMHEAIAVANAMGIKVEVYARKLDYYKFLNREDFFNNLKRHLTIYLIGFKYRKIKSSSLQSLERGKPTEIDYLNGFIAESGKRHGIPTPINDRIIQIIKEIETGKRKISMDNFNDSALCARS